ncbi:MAG: dephospho-CoA kinase [Bacteroidales bacterium]|nr:dephospho-CoA kinase [Bacteroidales bacterium]
MYKIALTGGIGTGKTYLSKHFVQMGVPVFYADDEAKKLYRDPVFVQQLRHLFGEEIFTDNQLDFKKMAALVFNHPDRLEQLNKLVHPAVMRMFGEWAEKQSSKAVIMESAIVFEGGLTSYFDKIIVADAPLELRIRRILVRNPELTRDEVLLRMSRQLPQDEKCRRADLVICTGETYCESKGI